MCRPPLVTEGGWGVGRPRGGSVSKPNIRASISGEEKWVRHRGAVLKGLEDQDPGGT